MAKYRNILIFTLGGAPAVVTETVYALVRPDPLDGETAAEPWVPQEIYIVTTIEGRADGEPALRGERSKLAELFRELGLEPVEPRFVVPRIEPDGEEITDIRTRKENVAYANRLTALVEELARKRDTCLHVSLAGGRKTMSSYAHAAISLFGRAQDELSHILVEPKAFETARSPFMWPGQRPEVVIEQNGTRYSSNNARVILVRSPFVPLGDYLRRHPFPKGDIDYARMIAHAKAALAAPDIVLDDAALSVTFGGETIGLGEQEYAFLRVLAAAKVEGWPGFGPGGAGENLGGWVAYKQFIEPGSAPYTRFFEYWRDCFAGATGQGYENFKDELDSEIERAAAAGRRQQGKTQRAWTQAAAGRFKAIKKRVFDQLNRAFGASPGAHLVLPSIAKYRRSQDKGWCVGLLAEPHTITIRQRNGAGAVGT
jgi:CRISPR-associated protein (TIGR02584 family)